MSLARLRRTIRRHARAGWERAVFAKPGDDGSEPIVVSSSQGEPSDEQLTALVDRAEAAARAGLVKQTFVIDGRTKVRIDARYGRAKVQTLDESTVSKMMGGKERALHPVDSSDLLRAIGIANPDGTISTRHAKKYKQVNHFVELCRPTLHRLRTPTEAEPLKIFDLACGNSYLTFVLAEALRLADLPAVIHGVDVREDVVERSRARARTLGWNHLSFSAGPIREVELPDAPDLVMALHACDTATDEALALAIRARAHAIFAAPCCQRELASQLASDTVPTPALAGIGLLKRDYAATLTDGLRVEILEAMGYSVDGLEFVTSDHTPKNLLLRAHRRGEPGDLEAIIQRCAALGIRPSLLTAVR